MTGSSKRRIWIRDRYVCQYCFVKCTQENVTVDHILSRQSGGGNNEDNLITACRDCNHKKGQKEEFIIYKK